MLRRKTAVSASFCGAKAVGFAPRARKLRRAGAVLLCAEGAL
jgi:hypothetical protein